MQTALTQLIEHLRISGNIHGAMEAEKFLPLEKNQLKGAFINGSNYFYEDAQEFSENYFNEFYNTNQ